MHDSVGSPPFLGASLTAFNFYVAVSGRRDQLEDLFSCGLIPPNCYVAPDGRIHWAWEHESYDDRAQGAFDAGARLLGPHVDTLRSCVNRGARLYVTVSSQQWIDVPQQLADFNEARAQRPAGLGIQPEPVTETSVSFSMVDFDLIPAVLPLLAAATQTTISVWSDHSYPGRSAAPEPTP